MIAEAVWREVTWCDNLTIAFVTFVFIVICIVGVDSFISFRRNRSKRKNVE